MVALDRSSRTLLAGGAFLAFAGAFIVTPIVAQDAGRAVREEAHLAPRATPFSLAAVVPHRDPFAGEPAPRAAASPPSAPALEAIPTRIPAAILPLPPNAGAFPLPFAAAEVPAARVAAVVTGPHPIALLAEAGTTRVVGIGDRVGRRTIVAITAAGVRLAGGVTLGVAAAAGSL